MDDCVLEYLRRLDPYLKKYENSIDSIEMFLGKDKFVELKKILNNMKYKHTELNNYARLLKKLGVANPNVYDAVALCKVITGSYNCIAFWEAYKHNVNRYDIFSEIYWVLDYLGIDKSDYLYSLVVGKGIPKDVKFWGFRDECDRQVVESDNYTFAVGKEVGKDDSNFKDACYSFENFTDVCLYYTPRNILVFDKRIDEGRLNRGKLRWII